MAAILAFIKAVPALLKIFEGVVDLYFSQQEAADHNHYDQKKIARDAIITKMMMSGVSDEEYKNLRRALYDLNRN